MSDFATVKSNVLVAEKCCHTRIKSDYCSYLWTIHKYSDYYYHCKKSVDSDWFSAKDDELEWILRLSPPNLKNNITLTLWLCCDQKRSDILVKCKMSVIDATKKETNVRDQSNYEKLVQFGNDKDYFFMKFPDFIDGENILNKETSLLKDDTLTIFCEIFFIDHINSANETDSSKSIITPYDIQESDLHIDLENIFVNELFSDLTLKVDGKTYKVHKVILSSRSQVFATMLQHDMKERNQNHIEIDDIDRNTFETMLRYIYTGKLSNLDEVAFDLLAAADKYDLERLKIMCEHSLIKKLSVENAVDILVLADMHSAALVKKQTVQYIKFHIEEVKKTENWSKVAQSNLINDVFDALHP